MYFKIWKINIKYTSRFLCTQQNEIAIKISYPNSGHENYLFYVEGKKKTVIEGSMWYIVKYMFEITPKIWSSCKKTGLEDERSWVRAPLVPSERGRCKYLCKYSLDWDTIPSP